MIGHQQFDQGLACGFDLLAVGLHHHVVLGFADACSGVDTSANIDNANAANADRSLVLLVAKRWNGNAVDASGVEDSGAAGNSNLLVVNSERDLFRRRHQEPPIRQTPARHSFSLTCASTSSRKCLITD